MNVRSLFLLAILCGLYAPAPLRAQGFAGLGSDANGFAAVVPGREIVFPRDFGTHPDFRIEWWYLTANLQTANGQQLGVQWTLFRQATKPGTPPSGWSRNEFWMGHAALTTNTQHFFAEKLARGGTGQAGAKPAPFEAWIDDWFFTEKGQHADATKQFQVSAAGNGFGYSLDLEEKGQPILHGEGGFSLKSDQGQASYYFSHPFLDVNGVVTIEGETLQVTGTAWLDREWSSQPLATNQLGWDWFSLRLDSGEKLMVFRLRDTNGGTFLSGTWITPDGEALPLASSDIKIEPLASSTDSGRKIPTRWSVVVSSKALDITVTPLNPNSWMATSVAYWEGPVLAKGSHSAQGYLEMTGY
ncbi:MAG: iron ABC transporter permease [Kordiimonadaceae bacterium]|nr:iron ABC transporter permease [Kordiimonadaceae bacterium]